MVYVCFAKENDAFCSLCRAYRSGKESDTGLYLSTFLAIPFAKVSEYFSNCQKGPSNWTRGYLYSVSDAALFSSPFRVWTVGRSFRYLRGGAPKEVGTVRVRPSVELGRIGKE